uniref:Uncharacterized protein n=1 Tax=Chromera velia CCMP2878 TaxID=1169474 RepID=A0A0G4HBN9_9ALVE|eukprot:Cvel_26000.t1-p1 / transcript=Cvel_26000.t1 / gene=Cvel_26000 / organism=Chromera_velia_CCMP2878 / gene_product=hypothetical protein / transcript_product=hypothetical protein / location=Cvel_scaffold3025:5410-7806(+) / protein_length=345 / sequence_SO=supercontig / SO=protein_coding / is_pseudo=false
MVEQFQRMEEQLAAATKNGKLRPGVNREAYMRAKAQLEKNRAIVEYQQEVEAQDEVGDNVVMEIQVRPAGSKKKWERTMRVPGDNSSKVYASKWIAGGHKDWFARTLYKGAIDRQVAMSLYQDRTKLDQMEEKICEYFKFEPGTTLEWGYTMKYAPLKTAVKMGKVPDRVWPIDEEMMTPAFLLPAKRVFNDLKEKATGFYDKLKGKEKEEEGPNRELTEEEKKVGQDVKALSVDYEIDAKREDKKAKKKTAVAAEAGGNSFTPNFFGGGDDDGESDAWGDAYDEVFGGGGGRGARPSLQEEVALLEGRDVMPSLKGKKDKRRETQRTKQSERNARGGKKGIRRS